MLFTNELANLKTASHSLSLSAIMLGAALTLTACGSDESHEVKAVDKVEEAAELAQANAPEAEPIETAQTQEAPATESESVAAADAAQEAVAEKEAEGETITEAQTETAESEILEAEASDADTATDSAPLAADAGKKLYDSQCQMCHATGLLGAPTFGDKDAWAPRIAKGIDTLHMHSAEGFNQMPAQAANGVSEAQVYAAVDYMVEQSS